MKKLNSIIITLCICTSSFAQKYIPFQYQTQSKWNYQEKWGLMTMDKKVILQPTYYNIRPSVITETYIKLGKNIVDLKTGAIVWDSIEAKDVSEIKGDIAKIRMPLRGAVNYQPYSFKNIKSKKVIAKEGRFSKIKNLVITEGEMTEEGVVDENGKVIIAPATYQKVKDNLNLFLISDNTYTFFDIYNQKGEKLNSTPYKNVIITNDLGLLNIAVRKIDNKFIFEHILINKIGKEIGPHFFTKKNDNYLLKPNYWGYAISNTKDTLYKDASCNPANIYKKNILANNEGKLILENDLYYKIEEIGVGYFSAFTNNSTTVDIIDKDGKIIISTKEYKEFTPKGEGLLTAISNTDSKKYLLNYKLGIVANVGVMQQDEVQRISNKNFVVYKKSISKLFFYSYDVKNGVSKAAEFVNFDNGLKINYIEKAFDKYCIVNVTDNNKQQYATYIYDVEGKLILKSEDGLFMYADGYLIKYVPNNKGEKFYLSYYDADLKPYSIIKE